MCAWYHFVKNTFLHGLIVGSIILGQLLVSREKFIILSLTSCVFHFIGMCGSSTDQVCFEAASKRYRDFVLMFRGLSQDCMSLHGRLIYE